MTQPSLLCEPPTKKKSRTQLVIEYFQARPNQWIDGLVFKPFAGEYAWSSRIREARRLHGLRIENRERRRDDGSVVSEYKFVP